MIVFISELIRIIVLFWAEPGPLDTSMQVEARTKTADPNLKRTCSDLLVQGQLLSCEASCSKLMKVLLEDHFTSGAHVDVFDV